MVALVQNHPLTARLADYDNESVLLSLQTSRPSDCDVETTKATRPARHRLAVPIYSVVDDGDSLARRINHVVLAANSPVPAVHSPVVGGKRIAEQIYSVVPANEGLFLANEDVFPANEGHFVFESDMVRWLENVIFANKSVFSTKNGQKETVGAMITADCEASPPLPSSAGTPDNSPQFQLRVKSKIAKVPSGRLNGGKTEFNAQTQRSQNPTAAAERRNQLSAFRKPSGLTPLHPICKM